MRPEVNAVDVQIRCPVFLLSTLGLLSFRVDTSFAFGSGVLVALCCEHCDSFSTMH